MVPLAERFQLTKIEGQVWISIYELLLNPTCSSKYEYTDFKKNQILKVKTRRRYAK
jgi:zinc finger MYND domain-containing protein 10